MTIPSFNEIVSYLTDNVSNEIIIAALATLVVTIVKLIDYKAQDSHSKADNMHNNFNATLDGLKSDSDTKRITSAILLRRYINDLNIWRTATPYKQDALNVISSLLRITPCGEFQKTLADSLSFTRSVHNQDFQYTNLQNAIIKVANNTKIDFSDVDFYMADLSYASINNAKCRNTVFKCCNMRNTTFRGCNLNNCDFAGANLDGVRFLDNTTLYNANFKGAINIPEKVKPHLNTDGKYCKKEPTNNYTNTDNVKSVFISSIGNLSPKQGEYMDALKDHLKRLGIDTLSLSKEEYRNSGQIIGIQSKIEKANGVIIVGLRNLLVVDGVYRPTSSEKRQVSNMWLPTSWNNIEAGIASALKKPILVIHQSDLNDGIFNKEINDTRISHIEAQISSDKFKKDLDKWIHENI
ncbi:MAG: pentapeptide repeat-containing protein [Alistipes sp.]|nr:pentapeptide repeat-containing protein [Alistipes sp.]